uniref:Uncharacterized protein n=1 Tax=Ailuropoda melanoleuca TaxID=9646 RepID=A0A7N5KFG7_AILME
LNAIGKGRMCTKQGKNEMYFMEVRIAQGKGVIHSLSCFIPPSDYPPFLYPFLPLPIILVLMFHR